MSCAEQLPVAAAPKTTLAAAIEVRQRLDVAAMHEKVLGIRAALKASGTALRKKNVLILRTSTIYYC